MLVSGLIYFAFMAAWLNLFLLIGLSHTVQFVLGALAVGIGLVNVKDFFAFRQGFSLSIPDSAKPGIYARIRRIVQAEHRAGAVHRVDQAMLADDLRGRGGRAAQGGTVVGRHELGIQIGRRGARHRRRD